MVYLRVSFNWIITVYLKAVLKVISTCQQLFNKLDYSLWRNLLPGKGTSIFVFVVSEKILNIILAKPVKVSVFTTFFMDPSHKMGFLTLLHFAFVYRFSLVKIFVLYIYILNFWQHIIKYIFWDLVFKHTTLTVNKMKWNGFYHV